MTNEEILEQEPCDELDFVQPHKKVSVNLEVCKMREATQKEREAIEEYIDSIAEPCDDAISRQEVFKQLKGCLTDGETEYKYVKLHIDSIPPVNPQPKTGYWISQPSNEEQGERPFIWWKCSNCGQVIFSETQHDRFEFHAFCGRCGAKMVDPSEGSGKGMNDLISRQWLMKCVNEGWIKFDTDKDGDRFIHLVRDIAPPAQPEHRWIPVSERLPEENKTVIASTKYSVYPETKYTKKYGWEWAYEAGADYWKELEDVTAWMPLPQPYKAESEDK